MGCKSKSERLHSLLLCALRWKASARTIASSQMKQSHMTFGQDLLLVLLHTVWQCVHTFISLSLTHTSSDTKPNAIHILKTILIFFYVRQIIRFSLCAISLPFPLLSLTQTKTRTHAHTFSCAYLITSHVISFLQTFCIPSLMCHITQLRLARHCWCVIDPHLCTEADHFFLVDRMRAITDTVQPARNCQCVVDPLHVHAETRKDTLICA